MRKVTPEYMREMLNKYKSKLPFDKPRTFGLLYESSGLMLTAIDMFMIAYNCGYYKEEYNPELQKILSDYREQIDFTKPEMKILGYTLKEAIYKAYNFVPNETSHP